MEFIKDDLDYYGYPKALRAAGAKVIAYEQFGSYQGSWIAYVEYNGKRGWILDEYGSCSGCDAFEGMIEDRNNPEELAKFGMNYLDEELLSDEEILKLTGRHADYSVEDGEMLKWVQTKISERSEHH